MTPEEIDAALNSVSSSENICGTLRELLDIMAQNPELYAIQIARACGYLHDMNCPPHTLCNGGES